MPDSQTERRAQHERSGKAEASDRRLALLEYMATARVPLSAYEVAEGSGLYVGEDRSERAFTDLGRLAQQGKLRQQGAGPVKFSLTPKRPSPSSASDGITEADERRGEEMREGHFDDAPPGWEP